MRLLCLASITIVIVLGSIVVATPINAHIINRHDEICKQTTLYPMTFPPGKAEHMILCHPIGKALAAANNANIQYNGSHNTNTKCPTGHTKDYCEGWDSTRIIKHFTCKKCGMSFEDKKHCEIHKGVHKHARSKVSEYATDMPWRPGL